MAITGVLAHEIGHHLNGDTIDPYQDTNPLLEIRADEYAGFIMRKMGATLLQAKLAFEPLSSENSRNSLYPSRTERLRAVEKGWNRGAELPRMTDLSLALRSFVDDARNGFGSSLRVPIQPGLFKSKLNPEALECKVSTGQSAYVACETPYYTSSAEDMENLYQRVVSIVRSTLRGWNFTESVPRASNSSVLKYLDADKDQRLVKVEYSFYRA